MAKVLISYYSKSGNTRKMAQILAKAAAKAGAKVTLKRAEKTTNRDLLAADAVALGSPDYFSYPAGQVKVIFDEGLSVKGKLSGKPALCFSSHGGGGKIKKPFEYLTEHIGFKLIGPCVLCQEAPAGKAVDELREAAAKLAGAAEK